MASFKRKRIPENPSSLRSMRRRIKGPSKVASLSRKVNKLLSEIEKKNLDSVGTNVAFVAGVAQVFPLNNIPQGDDAVSRDGRKVAMVSSQMRYSVFPTAAGVFRVIVLRDNQSNGVATTAADILTAPGNPYSPLTLDFKERFRVIHDNFQSVGKGDFDTSGVAANLYPFSYYASVADDLTQVEYGGIGAAPTTGSLVLLVLSTTNATVNYYHRLRFTDS